MIAFGLELLNYFRETPFKLIKSNQLNLTCMYINGIINSFALLIYAVELQIF